MLLNKKVGTNKLLRQERCELQKQLEVNDEGGESFPGDRNADVGMFKEESSRVNSSADCGIVVW